MTKSLSQKGLILYADDDPDDLELVRELFAKYASVVNLVTFENGLELLRYVKDIDKLNPQPCLIILDINMPLLDGKETLKKLRTIGSVSDVPAVLFTTSNQPHEAAFANKYDAGFITKPLHSAQVHMIVDQMLEYCTSEFRSKINKLRRKD